MAEELRNIDRLRPLLRSRPLGIFSDIDGTLAPIVSRPEDARISPRCRELLTRLIGEGVRVALITGRTLEMARKMTDVDGVAFAANHGVSVWIDGHDETPPAAHDYLAEAQRLFRELRGVGANGVFVEVTGPNLAFHYRRAVDQTAAREAILSAIASSSGAKAFGVNEGRKVIELRAPLGIDKGTAVDTLAARLGVRAIICLGDDRTDLDMFRALEQLRAAGLAGVSIAVRSAEATPEVLAVADYWIEGVSGVEWLLGEVLKVLRETAP